MITAMILSAIALTVFLLLVAMTTWMVYTDRPDEPPRSHQDVGDGFGPYIRSL